jgi:hypothetical protein
MMSDNMIRASSTRFTNIESRKTKASIHQDSFSCSTAMTVLHTLENDEMQTVLYFDKAFYEPWLLWSTTNRSQSESSSMATRLPVERAGEDKLL